MAFARKFVSHRYITVKICFKSLAKATEQYFHVVLFITLYKIIKTFKSVDESTLRAFKLKLLRNTLFCSVYFAVQGGSSFFISL